jgi:hypothetical protein
MKPKKEMAMRIFLALLTALFFAGCAGSGPAVDYDTHVDIGAYDTFNVARSETASIDPLNAERIENAIVDNLTAKGYRFDNGGEFTAVYDIRLLRDVPSNFSFGFGIGGYGSHGGGSVGTSVTPTSDKVEIRIDMVDAKTHKVFWSAAEEATMPDFTTPESRERFFRDVVTRLLAKFPDKKEGA